MSSAVTIDPDAIADFCRRYGIRRISLFGSVLGRDFRPESDVDFLVEFLPRTCVGLIGIARMERELSEIVGRRADLRTPSDLSRYFRDEVAASAELLYEQP
jgi:predicted nucleotidyltransferase